MIDNADERLLLSLTGRDLTITLSHGDEKRLRMLLDRWNAAEARYCDDATDPLDLDDDATLAAALIQCMEVGLSADEADHGLRAYSWGDVVTVEQHAEMERRGRHG